MHIQTLLLAAGSATRFGGDKLSAALPDGTPMVLASARALLQAGCDVLAVVREADVGAGLLLRDLQEVRVLCCPESVGGLGFSLAQGVRHSANADAWLVALADMPLIRPATLVQVLSALAGGSSLVAPVFAGQRGHPVGFGRCWRARLLELSGDRGARTLLTEQADRLESIQTDDPGILLDIDRRDDLHRIGLIESDPMHSAFLR
ncbi:MAG TPA: nucleotidyltransferase family protein [Chromatiaceae bacterium]|jgi:molybdenum cofactor cytidylyltransferase|nr:MAG: hypothetical protein N838_13390 [Thiohalocapsa sp. PB-PSB1]QQO54639.1 MAG: nucleotidyltransferase family protein [Thiohalocapsa sp. PB-PSB1]HBG94148.1 nucleotidyltransferase family protein [Chromatiaceae bacterium]HCS90002.1 nucleotidyltransferase family protein [Chromatiaceae bacterium]